MTVKDEEGFPSFALVNKVTGQAIKHSIGPHHPEEFLTFKAFLHRYATPHVASQSSSPLWYAIRHASAHIIVLSSYSPFGCEEECSSGGKSRSVWAQLLNFHERTLLCSAFVEQRGVEVSSRNKNQSV